MRSRTVNQKNQTIYGSLSKFLESPGHPSGVLTVMLGGLPIDILYEPRGYETTTVFFHAALVSKDYKLPFFAGKGVSADLPTNRVFIADPTLYLDERLALGWYAGNYKQPRLQYAIRGILEHLISKDQRMVTFGASGGGFAALYYASCRDGAIAVPINPQTHLSRYKSGFPKYARLAWGLAEDGAESHIPALTNVTTKYRTPGKRVFYIQNQNDIGHIENHFKPFMAALPEDHLVNPVLFDGKPGHTPPPKSLSQGVLAAAISGAISPPRIENLDRSTVRSNPL